MNGNLGNNSNNQNNPKKHSIINKCLNPLNLTNSTYSSGIAKSNLQINLQYKVLKSDSNIVNAVLEYNGNIQLGILPTEGHSLNVLWTSSYTRTFIYEGLNEFQKINHFPSISEITRKDNLCKNIMKMQKKYSKEAFDIIPETYILPDQFEEFEYSFQSQAQKGYSQYWIVKPCNLSRGRGIYIIDDLGDIQEDENCVVSKYISNPLLINGLKFDMRIYIVITCLEPLRIYIFDEGMARFASEKYHLTQSKGEIYSHLTNYSINKKNKNYVQNRSCTEDDYGNKWSLSALFILLKKIGIETKLLWSRIYDLIIKSILSAYPALVKSSKDYVRHRTNCF